MDGVRGLRLEGGIHFAVVWGLASGGRDVDVDQLGLNSTCSFGDGTLSLDREMSSVIHVVT